MIQKIGLGVTRSILLHFLDMLCEYQETLLCVCSNSKCELLFENLWQAILFLLISFYISANLHDDIILPFFKIYSNPKF